MSERKETACSCDECKASCRRPCWPTPTEARGLIELGYASWMMRDYWVGTYTYDEATEVYIDSNIYIICPAAKGSEGRTAPFWLEFEGCVLQTKNGLCSIHDSGFKPYEARVVGHDTIDEDRTLHEEVAMMWDSEEGRAVVDLWGRTVSARRHENVEVVV